MLEEMQECIKSNSYCNMKGMNSLNANNNYQLGRAFVIPKKDPNYQEKIEILQYFDKSKMIKKRGRPRKTR